MIGQRSIAAVVLSIMSVLSCCYMKPGTSVAVGVEKYLTEEENRQLAERPERAIEIIVASTIGEFDVLILTDSNKVFRRFENAVSPWQWKQQTRKGWGMMVAAVGKNKSARLTVRILANGKAMETTSTATTDQDGFPANITMGSVP